MWVNIRQKELCNFPTVPSPSCLATCYEVKVPLSLSFPPHSLSGPCHWIHYRERGKGSAFGQIYLAGILMFGMKHIFPFYQTKKLLSRIYTSLMPFTLTEGSKFCLPKHISKHTKSCLVNFSLISTLGQYESGN